jgi:exodeoxyribonuclease V beta subunit
MTDPLHRDALGATQRLDVLTAPLDSLRFIEASAGTGKTWALCALYLRLLLERGHGVRDILVVTFTQAATAELRERIRARLAEALHFIDGSGTPGSDPLVPDLLARLRAAGQPDERLRATLEAALRGFDEASVFTIHGFCQRALADAPFTARLPMQLEAIADDSLLREQAVRDFWRRRLGADTVDAALAAHLTRKKDCPDTHAQLLKRHAAKPLARLRWPDGLHEAMPVDATALQAAHATACGLWRAERQDIVERLTAALDKEALNGNQYTAHTLQRAAEEWDWLASQSDARHAFAEKLEKLEKLGRQRLHAKAKGKPYWPQHPFFDHAQHLVDLLVQARAPLHKRRLALLCRLLDEAGTALRDTKRAQRLVAFDDMLFNLYERLKGDDGPALAAALHQRFPVALVDEFQDTDPLQFEVFRTIHAAGGDGTLFLVGDPKQAIYSFRNADLPTYLAARTQAQSTFTLDDNQRSAPALIEAMNAVFGANRQAFMQPGLDYRPVGVGARTRRLLVDRSGGDTAPLQVRLLARQDGQPLLKKAARAAAVRATAAEVARLLAAGRRGEVQVDDGGSTAPLRAGDIAVLVRSHVQGSEIRQALAQLGVGSVEVSQAGIFASHDAEEMGRLLAAILQPAREPLLKAALSTGYFAFDAAALDQLGNDAEGLSRWTETFAAWRDTWIDRGAGVMLRRMMAESEVATRLLAQPDGERRMTNLLHLVECLQQAAAEHTSPEALWRWYQAQRREDRRDDTTQLRLESDQNLVQILTMHKAKGLEYGVVLCPFLWDGHPGQPESLDGAEYHDPDGVSVIDFRKEEWDDAEKTRIKELQRSERAAESLRLIYVALTRAVHRCIVIAGTYRAPASQGVSDKESRRSLLNWLVAGAGFAPTDWLHRKEPCRAPDEIEAAWHHLAATLPGRLSVATLQDQAGEPLAPDRVTPEALAALPPPARMPTAWRIGSYSSLAHGAAHEDAAREHDQRVPVKPTLGPDQDLGQGDPSRLDSGHALPPPASPVRPLPDEDDIVQFPRGSTAGDALHALLEAVDLGDASGWPEAIDRTLRTFRGLWPAEAAGQGALRARMLRRLLDDLLHTPLPVGTPQPLRLARVPAARQLKELEFHLPAHRLDAAALNRLLRAHRLPTPPLSFSTLRGYLRGFIDLVIEHDGRFFVVDWKSNHLGDRPDDYHDGAMNQAMAAQGYHLQALIYSLALDRFLSHRLVGYRREQHFGGVAYLFIRGVRPGVFQPDGRPTGLHFQRPAAELLDALSALLDGTGAPAATKQPPADGSAGASAPPSTSRSNGLSTDPGTDPGIALAPPGAQLSLEGFDHPGPADNEPLSGRRARRRA